MDCLSPTHPILRPIVSTEMKKALQLSNANKAPGPSGIKFAIVKLLPSNYIKTIINIFNAIIATKYWPTSFKFVNMMFIHKINKSKTDPLSFRPISLIEPFAKLFEKLITNRLNYYLEYHNILPSNQFGFRTGKSTTHSIYFIKEKVLENKKQHKTTLIATRDVEKAFDKVWFKGLLFKINNYFPNQPEMLAFFYNYLTNRKITPYFNNEKGFSFSPKAGVPQGSCLGPVLYLIFVSDIPPPIFPDTTISQYADDIIHTVTSDSKGKNKTKNAIKKLQHELDHTLNWERNWKIKTNIQKCKINYSGTTSEIITYFGGIFTENIELSIENPLRILGYHLNNYLSELSQIHECTKKANTQINRLYRFSHAPPAVKRHLYLALVQPLLTYPNTTLHQCNKTNISKLQKVQNKGVRFITNTKLNDRLKSENLHVMAKIEPINVRIHKLAKKTLYKLKENYTSENNQFPPTILFDSEYNYNVDRLNPPKISISEQIESEFKQNRKLLINTIPNDPENFVIPIAIYT